MLSHSKMAEDEMQAGDAALELEDEKAAEPSRRKSSSLSAGELSAARRSPAIEEGRAMSGPPRRSPFLDPEEVLHQLIALHNRFILKVEDEFGATALEALLEEALALEDTLR